MVRTDERSRTVLGRAGVISGCSNETRCGAATPAHRSVLPELRLASLHRSSALQDDRQRLRIRYLEVDPTPASERLSRPIIRPRSERRELGSGLGRSLLNAELKDRHD